MYCTFTVPVEHVLDGAAAAVDGLWEAEDEQEGDDPGATPVRPGTENCPEAGEDGLQQPGEDTWTF